MSEQEQRIAIAEACGWQHCKISLVTLCTGESMTCDGWNHDELDDEGSPEPPDYLNDLNAMADAERTLDVNKLSIYADELEKVCVPVHICALTHWSSVVMASAAQRAEAFLKAIGKWKE